MEWISVKDRLPAAFKVVIVSGGIGLWTGVQWNTITGYKWPGQPIAWEVKYWMELPKAPVK